MKRSILIYMFSLLLYFAFIPIEVNATVPDGVPDRLYAPAIDKIELIKDNSGDPIFRLEVKIHQDILDLDEIRPANGFTFIEYYCKIDDGEWELVDGGYMDNLVSEPENKVSGKINTFYAYVYPISNGNLQTVDLKEHTNYYKAQLHYQYYFGDNNDESDFIYSAFSNQVSKGIDSFYSKVSDWAIPQLEMANNLGIIPGILKGSDMTKYITREEFAELAVRFYEIYTGITPSSKGISFTDTNNIQILKAAGAGLVFGVGNGKFAPNNLITREQMAVILLKTLKVINTNGDYTLRVISRFSDDINISSWAKDAVYYCANNSVVSGVGQNRFNPRGTATREQAIIVCTKAYQMLENSISQADIQGLWSTIKSSGVEVDSYGNITNFTYTGDWFYFGADGKFRYTIVFNKKAAFISGQYKLDNNKVFVTNVLEGYYPDKGSDTGNRAYEISFENSVNGLCLVISDENGIIYKCYRS